MTKIVNMNKLKDAYESSMFNVLKKYERCTEATELTTSDKEAAKDALDALEILNDKQIRAFCENTPYGKIGKDGKLHSLDKDDLEEIFKTYKEWAKKGRMMKA